MLHLHSTVYILKWPDRVAEWKSKGHVPDSCKIMGANEPDQWFTQPDVSGEDVLYPFQDFVHILTNTRAHICHGGYKYANVIREAWEKAAKELSETDPKNPLSLSYVEDGLDIQSMYVAKSFFTEKVEAIMRKNGDYEAVEFCKVMRQWFKVGLKS